MTETKFSEADYGVAASARVAYQSDVPKGGGRAMVGKPYQIAGRWYTPAEDPDYNESGKASWYGPNFHGRRTANGEVYDQYHLSAAHPTFPLPSYARVTNEANGRSVIVRVNDRGPFAHNRIIDVSSRAADLLGFKQAGVANVNVEYVGPARMDGMDMPFLMASFEDENSRNALPPGVLVAMDQTADDDMFDVASSGALTLASASAPVVEAGPGADASGEILPLPDIGPVPGPRPSLMMVEIERTNRSYAAAYSASDMNVSNSAHAAFESLLRKPATLTPAAIVHSWKSRQPYAAR